MNGIELGKMRNQLEKNFISNNKTITELRQDLNSFRKAQKNSYTLSCEREKYAINILDFFCSFNNNKTEKRERFFLLLNNIVEQDLSRHNKNLFSCIAYSNNLNNLFDYVVDLIDKQEFDKIDKIKRFVIQIPKLDSVVNSTKTQDVVEKSLYILDDLKNNTDKKEKQKIEIIENLYQNIFHKTPFNFLKNMKEYYIKETALPFFKNQSFIKNTNRFDSIDNKRKFEFLLSLNLDSKYSFSIFLSSILIPDLDKDYLEKIFDKYYNNLLKKQEKELLTFAVYHKNTDFIKELITYSPNLFDNPSKEFIFSLSQAYIKNSFAIIESDKDTQKASFIYSEYFKKHKIDKNPEFWLGLFYEDNSREKNKYFLINCVLSFDSQDNFINNLSILKQSNNMFERFQINKEQFFQNLKNIEAEEGGITIENKLLIEKAALTPTNLKRKNRAKQL